MAWTGMVTSAGTAAKVVIVILLIFIVFSLLGWWIYRLMAYNKRCTIKICTGGGTPLREEDFAKQKKDKETGGIYWRLKKRKLIIPRPPAKSIGLTKKGKEYAEFIDTGQGHLIPIDASVRDFDKDKEFIWQNKPVTETQRSFVINQIKKSQLFKKTSLSQILEKAIPYIALVMIIAVFLLFLSEGMKPIIQQAEIARAGSKDFLMAAQIMERSVQTLNNVQVIGNRPPGNMTPPD